MNSKPIKINPTPIQKLANKSSEPFFPKRRRKAPIPTKSGAKNSGFKKAHAELETWVKETIHAVIVVPIFAPMIIPTD